MSTLVDFIASRDDLPVRHARIRIFIRDGIVFGAETFEGEHVAIDVIDYDTGGHDPDELEMASCGRSVLRYTT